MAAADVIDIECVFCLSKWERMVEPRVLPCTHVSCKGCLIGQLQTQKVVWCKECSQTFNVSITDLPAYAMEGSTNSCDVCAKRKKGVIPAVAYCRNCSKKFCKSHKEHHDELHDDHVTLPITKYVEQAERLETRNCAEHRTEAYSMACAVCLTVFCTSCISPGNVCKNGKPHELLNLGGLVGQLAKDISRRIEMMKSKEEKLSELCKKARKEMSKFEAETTEMLRALCKARDEQIDAIRAKYTNLQKQLVMARQATKRKLAEFVEEQVQATLSHLSVQRAEIETRLRSNHHVDIIRAYKNTQQEVTNLTSGELQQLNLTDVKCLRNTNESRDLEVEITSASRIVISCEPDPVVKPRPKSIKPLPESIKLLPESIKPLPESIKPLPRSITLQKSVNVGQLCSSLCHYKGNYYLCLDRGDITAFDESLVNRRPICQIFDGCVTGIGACQDKIYVTSKLSSSSKQTRMSIWNLNGRWCGSWNHGNMRSIYRLTATSDKIVCLDTYNVSFTVYSLTGQIIKQISLALPHNYPSTSCSSLCAVNNDSVIVTSRDKSVVLRVNINSGQTVWKCKEVIEPHAAALYRDDLVCVYSRKELKFLDINSGKVSSVVELAVQLPYSVGFFSPLIEISINGDQIAILDKNSNSLSIQRLHF